MKLWRGVRGEKGKARERDKNSGVNRESDIYIFLFIA